MNKKELAKKMKDLGAVESLSQGERVLGYAIDIITGELSKGKEVSLFGFGKFEVVKTKARMGRNPQTGEEIQIKAGKKVKFKPATALKESI